MDQIVKASEGQRVDVMDFEATYIRFQGPITNFLYHLVGNFEQARDLSQDVFVKAYKALLGGTLVEDGTLSAWLYRIAANTATDVLRRRRLLAMVPMSLFIEDRGIGAGVLPSDKAGFATDTFCSREEYNPVYGSFGGTDSRFENRVADREIIERIFKQLPLNYALCLWFYEHDGLSCAQIAEVLNISASAVKMRLMRARERFLKLYRLEMGEDVRVA